MSSKLLICVCTVLIYSVSPAFAELSSNPWLIENEAEDVNAVYKKEQRRQHRANLNYAPAAHVTIDRSDAYVEVEKDPLPDDANIMDKLKNALKSREEKTDLVPKTKARRKKQYATPPAPEPQKSAESEGFSLPSFGFGKQISGLKKNLKLPSFNVNSLIHKFEKASGVNLKAIGKQLR